MKRREFLINSLAGTALILAGSQTYLRAEEDDEEPLTMSYQETANEITGNAKLNDGSGMMTLDIPDAPPNGATVPVEVTVDHPMEAGNYIAAIHVLTTKNKINHVISANFTPANGKAYLYVNAKLGGTQEVVILAETNDGKFYKASKSVKVALGGCG